MRINSKLPDTGTTIFSVMSALANEYKAVNLGQGFPDYPMSAELTDLVNKAMKDGYNQYAPMPGYIPLRETIAEKIKYLYNADINPDTEITITPGGTYAIFSALTVILNPGDEVIVMQPNYDSYVPNILVNGAVPVLIDLELPRYSVNWEKVKEAIGPKTKAIILNSPHNPTGSILSENDIKELIKIVEGTDIFIISDEVYEHIVFDGAKHESMLKYPELYKRSFVCFSFGKVYHCTGWKIGYCVAPPALTKEFIKVHQYNAFSTNSPMQVALASYLRNKESYNSLSAFFQKKRDYFISAMKQTKFSLFNSAGSYFICASYENIS
ncbi:MAG: aminotransferase class I/II-fold pyridoxal phosphate-dependent enzyme, partial [Chitinophagaceae bacterium]|nr:aminotransferase class I/II-fold pyridoxal phosphate-dependent enzyme [Chitinophagaceae bacterium]